MESLSSQFLPKNHLNYALWVSKNSDVGPILLSKSSSTFVLISRSQMDFLHGFVCKSILEVGMGSEPLRRCAHFGEDFFGPKRDHFSQAQLHLKCRIPCTATLRLPRDFAAPSWFILKRCFTFPSEPTLTRAWTKMTWLMLKQNSLKLLLLLLLLLTTNY